MIRGRRSPSRAWPAPSCPAGAPRIGAPVGPRWFRGRPGASPPREEPGRPAVTPPRPWRPAGSPGLARNSMIREHQQQERPRSPGWPHRWAWSRKTKMSTATATAAIRSSLHVRPHPSWPPGRPPPGRRGCGAAAWLSRAGCGRRCRTSRPGIRRWPARGRARSRHAAPAEVVHQDVEPRPGRRRRPGRRPAEIEHRPGDQQPGGEHHASRRPAPARPRPARATCSGPGRPRRPGAPATIHGRDGRHRVQRAVRALRTHQRLRVGHPHRRMHLGHER